MANLLFTVVEYPNVLLLNSWTVLLVRCVTLGLTTHTVFLKI